MLSDARRCVVNGFIFLEEDNKVSFRFPSVTDVVDILSAHHVFGKLEDFCRFQKFHITGKTPQRLATIIQWKMENENSEEAMVLNFR